MSQQAGVWRHRRREYSFGIECFADGLSDEDDQQQREEQHAVRIEDQPPLRQVFHTLSDQLAPARRGRRQAEAEEVERDERTDVGDDDERRERDDRRQGVWQDVAEDDRRVGHAGRDRRADVVLRLLAIELAADVIGDAHPVERRQDDDQQPERRLQQAGCAPAGTRERRPS